MRAGVLIGIALAYASIAVGTNTSVASKEQVTVKREEVKQSTLTTDVPFDTATTLGKAQIVLEVLDR